MKRRRTLFLTVLISSALWLLRRRGDRPTGQKAVEKPRRTLWIFDHYAVPPSLAGFTRQYEHAELLKAEGWDTTIFATPFNHKLHRFDREVSPLRSVRSEDEHGVQFLWLYSVPYSSNNWRRYANMLSYLVVSTIAGMRREKPDVVLGSSPHLFAAFAGWLVARWHRVPFVLEVRDLWPDSLIQMGLQSSYIIRPLRLLERHLYERSSAIVALTDSIAMDIEHRGTPASRISMIPNASMASERLTAGDRDRLRKSMGWADKVVFIYAGAHGSANALEYVVDAARLVADDDRILFAFLGDGPEKPALRQRATGLKNTVFLDPVPKKDVFAYLQVADVGVLSLRRTKVFEGARPNKLFDYTAVGLPVLNTSPGETEDLIAAACAGVTVPPEDVQALASAARHLATVETRRRLAANSADLGTKFLTRHETALLLAGILKTLTK